ncbi:MAG: hypothetical protein QG592_263 [Pseudomonadota bacterium]|nr:hypothetical protein [Pseudomonadota bacterium]
MSPTTPVSAGPRRVSHWLAHAAVVAALMLLSRADWILSSLYHGDQSVAGIGLAVAALFAVALLVLVPAALLVPSRLSEAALRVLTVAAAVYVFQPAIRALPIFPPELTSIHKIGLAVTTLVLAWLAAAKLSPSQWRRMQKALLVGGLLFVSFPMLAVRALEPIQMRMPAGHPAQGATVVLLLDELNAEAGEQIATAIAQAGGQPRTHRIKSVGDSTITVIPEMFGAPHVPQARVCTPTAVCDRSGMFDFAKLRFDPADRVHIVGFHHPYCAANGLMSCERFAPPSRPPVSSLLCSFGRLIPGRHASDCDWFAPDDWQAFRLRVRDAALGSPFWTSGGTLYAHLPFPHPPGHLPEAGLQADYAANLDLAGQIAAQIWRQGRDRFGEKFRLIVTSDHPLRPALWCRHSKYRETGCVVAPTAFEGQVPFIAVGSDAGSDTAPVDNAHIFNPSSRTSP